MTITRVALGKINHRYYWAVRDWTRLFEETQPEDDRIEDGFCDERADAVNQIKRVLDRVDPDAAVYRERYCSRYVDTRTRRAVAAAGDDWNRARAETGCSIDARHLYGLYHKRQPKPSDAKDARGDDLGYLYTYEEPYDHWIWKPYWKEHRITKVTAKKIFIAGDSRPSQLSFYKSDFDRKGCSWHRGTREVYYSAEGMERMKGEWAASAKEARSVKGEEASILGISGDCTCAEIIKAFREKSKIYHPDFGGTNEQFIALCAAKDNALARARAA